MGIKMGRNCWGILWVWVALLGLPPLTFANGTLFLSDIDDTVKITHVNDASSLARNGLFGHKVFLGMAELYQEWMNHGSVHPNEILYLSRSPQVLFPLLDCLLFRECGFPKGEMRLRTLSDLFGGEDFKVVNIRDVMRRNDRSVVLVGDDTQSDPQIFSKFKDSERVLASYIHQVRGVALPEGITPYVTAFDLALYEVEAQRLTSTQAIRIGQVILDSDYPELLFPKFKRCPAHFSYTMRSDGVGLGPIASLDSQLVEIALQVKNYIQLYCTYHRFI